MHASMEHPESAATGPLVVGAMSIPVTIAWTRRDLAALVILLLVALVAAVLAPFASALFGAAILYVICRRAHESLARRVPEGVAAALVIAGVVALIISPLAWLVLRLVSEAPAAVAVAQQSGITDWLNHLRIGPVVLGEQVAHASGTIMTWLSAQLVAVAASAGSAALDLGIALLGLYYLLRAPAGHWETIREYIPFSTSTVDALRDRFVGVTEATVLGTGVGVVAQGVIIGGGFAIVGLPNALFWGAVASLTAIIPLIGSTLVWGPAALLLLTQGRYGAATAMVVLGGGIAGNVDQVVRPLLSRRRSHLHPMITLVGALAGIRFFGLVGIILGPLAISYVFELMHFFRAEYSQSHA